jgi:HK97 family phage prohead protease
MGEKKLERTEYLTAQGCQFRKFENFEIRADGATDETAALYVEGLATPFNKPTVLYSYDGVDFKEEIDARAFDGANLSDVIFNYNHAGKVVARTRNNTLTLEIRADGLHMRARLDGTQEGRKLYEEIKGGYIDRMSFAFTTLESSYNADTHTRTILKVKKVYDVSAVDIPAYDTTSINARNFFAVEIAKEEKAAAAATLRKEVLQTEIEQTIKNYNGGMEK